MSWVRLDDQFPDHPKVVAAGPAAGWLYVCGLAYCARYLTDGFIPKDQVRRLADVGNAQRQAEILVSVGLWEHSDGGYRVHDYLEYNPSKEKVLATRELRAEVGSRGGKQRASNLLEAGQAVGTNNDATLFKQNRTPSRTPTPSLSNDSEEREPNGSAADAAGSAPADTKDQLERRGKDDGKVYALVDAFAVVTKRRSNQIQGRDRKEAADAFRPIAGEATADDVVGCAAYLRSDPFWREPGKLTARKLAQTIPEWIADGRPASVNPRASPGSRNGLLTADELATMARELERQGL